MAGNEMGLGVKGLRDSRSQFFRYVNMTKIYITVHNVVTFFNESNNVLEREFWALRHPLQEQTLFWASFWKLEFLQLLQSECWPREWLGL